MMDDEWGYSRGPSPGQWKPCSPSPSMIQLLLATNDPMTGMNFTGRITPDMMNSVRRSRTRSIGNPNSPSQFSFSNFLTMASPGFIPASPLNPFRPLSAGASSHSRSPRIANGFRPPSVTSHGHPRSPLVVANFRAHAIPAPETAVAPVGQKTQGSARGPRFKSSEWESHKAKIKELFMDEDKSLEETMRIMDQEFAFSPSKKQYNNKFKQWGFIKNISGATASWMVNKARARRREGKETEFSVGDHPWTMDRIERSAKRAKIEGNEAAILDPNTPPDVRYGTPCMGPPAVPGPLRDTAAQAPKWDPFSNPEPVTPTFLRLQWNGKSKADLEVDRTNAIRLASIGWIQEAEDCYLQVLGGYQALLSPTHKETNSVAYELAEFYAENDRMEDADRILDWMGEKHLERWGIDHKSVRGHFVKVADMLQSWSREDDAVSMLSRAADCYEQSVKSPQSNIEAPRLYPDHHIYPPRDDLRLPPILGGSLFAGEDGGDEIRMDYQVRVAITRANAEDVEAEKTLLSLCEQCERYPGKLAVQILEARKGLVEFYKKLALTAKYKFALDQVQGSFWRVFKSNATRTELLLDTAIELITWLVKAGRPEEAEPLLQQVQDDAIHMFGEDDEVTISILIRIGIMLQEHDHWSHARKRFEQALAASMTNYGMESKMTLRLEEALYQKSYVASPPSPKDVRRVGRRDRWNTKTLGHIIGCGSEE